MRSQTMPQLDLLDSCLDLNPSLLEIASIEQSLKENGSTWLKLDRRQGSVENAWYANSQGEAFISTGKYGKTEVMLANTIRKFNKPDSFVQVISKGLTDAQRDSAKICLSNRISCLSGLPGTGKTYTCRAIAESYSKSGYIVQGCALTGIAAKRLGELAQINSTTIHRLLGFNGTSFLSNCIDCDVLIIDEASITDNQLILSVLTRMPANSRVVLVGDPNQLPSIDPSDTFRELCKVLPHAHLSEVLRQESDSPIGHAAIQLLKGHVPSNETSESGGGIYVIECEGIQIAFNGKRIKNHPLTIAEAMAEKDGTELRFIRTMACTNETSIHLNSHFTRFRKDLKSKVPVMCLKNRHDLGVYNGSIGYREYQAQIFDDKIVRLRESEQEDAWSTTVDKQQGNECLSGQLWIEPFLGIRRAYTALTRAKRRFCFVGNKELMDKCINTPESERCTLLAAIITGEAIYTDITE